VLLLAPHTDDVEFGCGGVVSRLVRQGCDLRYVAFSDCKESIPDGIPQDTLSKEMLIATDRLGLTDVQLLDYSVRHFPSRRQDILEHLVRVNRDFSPDLVLTPTTTDIHQDHATVTCEALRAFKKVSILGYELPWNNLTLPSQVLLTFDATDLEAKIHAVEAYRSQSFRYYASAEYIKSLALTRGARVGARYAEAFEPIRIVL
jgi:LmbE family N-acetylglucosaminyl deacetylase